MTSDLRGLGRKIRRNSPKAIARASQAAVNRTATTLRTKARRMISDEVQPRRGAQGAIGKLITVRKATSRGAGSLTAHIDFSELGLGVENTRKATIRKVRGKAGRFRVQVKGQSLVKAFKLGDGGKPLFTRSRGKIKRLFSYTVIQEANKADVWDELAREAPSIFVPQFLRLVDIFDGFDSRTDRSGRRI